VGDFDKDEVRKALADGLKGWRKAPTYQRPDDPLQTVAPKVFDINTPDKAKCLLSGGPGPENCKTAMRTFRLSTWQTTCWACLKPRACGTVCA